LDRSRIFGWCNGRGGVDTLSPPDAFFASSYHFESCIKARNVLTKNLIIDVLNVNAMREASLTTFIHFWQSRDWRLIHRCAKEE
jgi:hypothetical protein